MRPKSAPPKTTTSSFHSRQEELQLRVNAAATALHDQGLRPTVARVRSALGGGSPNDLTPALKRWKDAIFPTQLVRQHSDVGALTNTTLPAQVADLMNELWGRALVAASLETKSRGVVRESATRVGEAQTLRQQISSLRDRLNKESAAYGELRAQSARHEAITREALARADAADSRERTLLREVSSLRQKVSELAAVLKVIRHDSSSNKTRKAPKPKPSRRASRAPTLKSVSSGARRSHAKRLSR